jgi:hypothetical protein
MRSKILCLVAMLVLLVFSLVFSVAQAGSPVAPSCGSVCVQNLNTCKASCAGNPNCLSQCQAEYECCQVLCHGGVCRKAK